ncbi:family 43 glycosylhydrolase [Natronoglomus mannanivorans]|uniref:Family 43 glycosylhydrolase n=1 Tax=Natronoglomus mannanivorans TaxID=2979990 RepID=A0AAP3E4N3_9EURY|nr:family 43 glycosylhydrolase [Halobacteria archaeon AArc-xg1-1]
MDDDTHARYGRRDVLTLAGAGAVGTASVLSFSGSGLADDHEDTFQNPTGPFGFGDPDVIRTCDGTYYAYGTETPEDVVPIARSDDLVNWTYIGAALESQPDWRDDPDAGVWAPTINWYNGQYYLYYSYSTWGSQQNPGIGLATADTPEGPFEDQGPVFRAEDLPMTNAIDPDFLLVDGTPYMVWGSWYGLYAVELTPDGRDYVPDTAFHLAGDLKEGPMIVEENDYYYLFYSTGHCCDGYDSTYELEVGRSESFFGPYYNQNGDDLRELDEHHDGVSILTGTDRFVGPGHNTAIQDDDGDWWAIYHAEATTEYSNRIMMVDRIRWDDDDWPVVGDDGTPSVESPVPIAGSDRCGSTIDLESGTYYVVNENSGKLLDGDSDDASDGGTVDQRDETGHVSQEWILDSQDDGLGSYTLENAASGLVLAVADAETAEGVPLQQSSSDGSATQRWYVVENGDGTVRLENAGTGLVAAIEDGSTADGADAVQRTWYGGDEQRWHLVSVGDDDCVDAGLESGPVCDVDGDGRYRDFTGNGEVTTSDVVEFFDQLESDGVQTNVEYFDYTGTGRVTASDVVELFGSVSS